MSSFGKIDVFQPESEVFSAYLEQTELYFEANGIEKTKQVPVFLSSLDSKTYSLSNAPQGKFSSPWQNY